MPWLLDVGYDLPSHWKLAQISNCFVGSDFITYQLSAPPTYLVSSQYSIVEVVAKRMTCDGYVFGVWGKLEVIGHLNETLVIFQDRVLQN